MQAEPFSPSDEQRLLGLAFRDERVSSVLNGRGAVVASSQPSGPAAILFLALPNEVELKGPWVVEDTNAMVAKRLGKSKAEVGVVSSEDVARVLSDIRPSGIVTMTVNEKHNVTQIVLVVDSESGVVRRFYPAVTPPTVDPRSIPAGSSPTTR